MSLDALCERNLNMFELKLNFHTQKMEETILNSARFVVRTLSGPSDRLRNEVCIIIFTSPVRYFNLFPYLDRTSGNCGRKW